MAPPKPTAEKLAAKFVSASGKLNATTIDLAGSLRSFSNTTLTVSNELAGASALRKLRNADRRQFSRLAAALAEFTGQLRDLGDLVKRHNAECVDAAGILATLLDLLRQPIPTSTSNLSRP